MFEGFEFRILMGATLPPLGGAVQGSIQPRPLGSYQQTRTLPSGGGSWYIKTRVRQPTDTHLYEKSVVKTRSKCECSHPPPRVTYEHNHKGKCAQNSEKVDSDPNREPPERKLDNQFAILDVNLIKKCLGNDAFCIIFKRIDRDPIKRPHRSSLGHINDPILKFRSDIFYCLPQSLVRYITIGSFFCFINK